MSDNSILPLKPDYNKPRPFVKSWESGPHRAITFTTWAAIISAALVILSAGILGYTALFDLFVSIGLFGYWLAIFFPLLFDLAEVSAAVSVLNARLQGEDDKFAWFMVLLFTVLGIVANIGHATAAYLTGKIDQLQVVIAIFATSLFPLSVALVTHLVKRVLARSIERQAAVSTLAELSAQIATRQEEVTKAAADLDIRRAELDTLNGQIEVARAALKQGQIKENPRNVQVLNAARQAKVETRRQEVLSLLAEGQEPKGIAAALKVDIKTIRRDIAALNGKVARVEK